MVHTNHATCGESVQTSFWQEIAAKIRATERDGHYHTKIDGEGIPLCDCLTGEIAETPGLGLVVDKKSTSGEFVQTETGDMVCVAVGSWKLSAIVSHVEQQGVIQTVWLCEPELIDVTSTWDMGGEPTKEDLKYLGA